MSFKIIGMNVRTSSVGELRVEKMRDDSGKEFDAKTISFTVVSNRPRKSRMKDDKGNVVTENGKPVMVYKPDFVRCKATGSTAQVIEDYCKTPKMDGNGSPLKDSHGNQKYHSRQLNITGHLETYTQIQKIEVDKRVNINGSDYDIKFPLTVPVERTVYVVENINDFLDPNPASTHQTAAKVVETTISVTPVSVKQASNAPVESAQLDNDAKVIIPNLIVNDNIDTLLSLIPESADVTPF